MWYRSHARLGSTDCICERWVVSPTVGHPSFHHSEVRSRFSNSTEGTLTASPKAVHCWRMGVFDARKNEEIFAWKIPFIHFLTSTSCHNCFFLSDCKIVKSCLRFFVSHYLSLRMAVGLSEAGHNDQSPVLRLAQSSLYYCYLRLPISWINFSKCLGKWIHQTTHV